MPIDDAEREYVGSGQDWTGFLIPRRRTNCTVGECQAGSSARTRLAGACDGRNTDGQSALAQEEPGLNSRSEPTASLVLTRGPARLRDADV